MLKDSQQLSEVLESLFVLESPTIQRLINDLKQGKRNLKDSDFADLDLSGLDFSHTDLRNCNFFNCELRNVNFTGADLREANFKGANLKTANLTETDLSNANLSDTDLCHVSFEGATLQSAKFLRNRCHKTLLRKTTLPDGTLVKFKMRVTGDKLSETDVIRQYQQSHKSQSRLGEVLLLLCCYLGFQFVRFSFSLFGS